MGLAVTGQDLEGLPHQGEQAVRYPTDSETC